ncbi:MAG TPA: hypothetical protein IAD46_02975 [Candidatus Pelethenecus faecipullorum]|uniref:Uncharacterized protein n=1 Tax=Candidatus Pelethenecus faecipullorum TaxID=2840900 RepID=A0A9D1KK52_9MOLU|nr:hypothetical protein [Candidatus Pelethenecus faecipullorum]
MTKKKDTKIQSNNYKNPTKTPIGKILILILTAAMALVSVALLIYYIVISITNV